MLNEKYTGRLGHTEQLLRIKGDKFEYSFYKVRQRKCGKNKKTGCTTRYFLVKRMFYTGTIIKCRITKIAYEEIKILNLEEQFTKCNELTYIAKQKTFLKETPEKLKNDIL